MKTILFKDIDGIDIVTGFGKLQINPIETRENFDKKIKELKEFKELEKLSSEYIKYRYKKDMSKDELKKKLDKLKEKKEEINEKMGKDSDYIVYFEVKKNEKVLSKKEYDKYKLLYEKAVKNNNYLSVDKTETQNLKGKEYFIEVDGKLERRTIDRIGLMIPVDAIDNPTKSQTDELEKEEASKKLLKMTKKEIKEEYRLKKKEIVEKTQDRVTELMLDGATAKEAGGDAVKEFSKELEELKSDYSQT